MENSLIGIIILFLSFYFLLFLYHFFKTNNAKKVGYEILKSFSGTNLSRIEIQFSETRYSGTLTLGGNYSKATMYYSDRILIFIQNDNSYFGSINNSLPLIISTEYHGLGEVSYKDVKRITIKSDEYILDISKSVQEKRLKIYSEKENNTLKNIFNSFQEILNQKTDCTTAAL